jgi:hypothetical protein
MEVTGGDKAGQVNKLYPRSKKGKIKDTYFSVVDAWHDLLHCITKGDFWFVIPYSELIHHHVICHQKLTLSIHPRPSEGFPPLKFITWGV